jgi:hypothetical protein
MARVLIVAKTHLGEGAACVGGLNLETNKSIRLLTRIGSNQPANTSFDVGHIWELEYYYPSTITPPHVEDVVVTRSKYLDKSSDVLNTLLQRVPIWHGNTTELFEHLLAFENGRAYIDITKHIPNCSTGYWQSDHSLTLSRGDKPFYQSKHFVTLDDHNYHVTTRIPYVGFAEPLTEIPANTLVRVSLARASKKEENLKDRCYLQISGWYL